MINQVEENKISITPLGKFDYQLNVVNDKTILITEEEFEGIKNRSKCFDLERNCVVDYDCSIDKRIKTISGAISERKKFLSNSDYQLFKYIEGEMTASEFEPIKSQRALWRKEINQLEDELKRYGAI